MKRKDFMRSPVKHIDLEKIKTLSELVDAFKHSGGYRHYRCSPVVRTGGDRMKNAEATELMNDISEGVC